MNYDTIYAYGVASTLNGGYDVSHYVAKVCSNCYLAYASYGMSGEIDSYYAFQVDGVDYYIDRGADCVVGSVHVENHTYGDWYTIKGSTCTTTGTLGRECSQCKYVQKKSTASVGAHTICTETTPCTAYDFHCVVDPTTFIHYHTYNMSEYKEKTINGISYPYMYDYVDDGKHWKVVVAGYKCAHYKAHEKQGITPFYHYKHSNFGDQNENAYKNQTTYKQNSFYFYGGCLCDDCLDWSNRNTDKYNDNFIVDGLGSGSTFDFNRVKNNYERTPLHGGYDQVLGMGKFVLIDYKNHGKLIAPPSSFNSTRICENHNTTNPTDMTTCVNYGKACDCGFVVQASEYDKAYKGIHNYIVYSYFTPVASSDGDGNPLTCELYYDTSLGCYVNNYILWCDLCEDLKHIDAKSVYDKNYRNSNWQVVYGEHHTNNMNDMAYLKQSIDEGYRIVYIDNSIFTEIEESGWYKCGDVWLHNLIGTQGCSICSNNIEVCYYYDGYTRITWYATGLGNINYAKINSQHTPLEALLRYTRMTSYCYQLSHAVVGLDYYSININLETITLSYSGIIKSITLDNFYLSASGDLDCDFEKTNFIATYLIIEIESNSLDHAIDISSKNSVRKKED